MGVSKKRIIKKKPSEVVRKSTVNYQERAILLERLRKNDSIPASLLSVKDLRIIGNFMAEGFVRDNPPRKVEGQYQATYSLTPRGVKAAIGALGKY